MTNEQKRDDARSENGFSKEREENAARLAAAEEISDSQELRSKLWKLGLDCNRVVDELSRAELIRALIIHAENRDDWKKQANVARLELRAAQAEAAALREKLKVAIVALEMIAHNLAPAKNIGGVSRNIAREALAALQPAEKGEK